MEIAKNSGYFYFFFFLKYRLLHIMFFDNVAKANF